MNDEELTAILRPFATRARPRPLSPEADARIEARVEAAFDDTLDGAGHVEPDEDVELPSLDFVVATNASGGDGDHQRRRRFALLTAAAAVLGLLVGIVLVQTNDVDPVSDEGLPSMRLLEPGARWSLLTGLVPVDGPNGGAASASIDVRISGVDGAGEEQTVTAEARVSIADTPPRQYLGSVRFVIEPLDVLRIPLLLLDPETPWVDCDATVDLAGSGSAACGADTVDYRAERPTAASVDTPFGEVDAVGTPIEWTLAGAPESTLTTIWVSPTIGPVRIDVEAQGRRLTYELVELDDPTTTGPATTETTGD